MSTTTCVAEKDCTSKWDPMVIIASLITTEPLFNSAKTMHIVVRQSRQKFGLEPSTAAEYVALQAQREALGAQVTADAISNAFEQIDTNGDGAITLQELSQGVNAILQEEMVSEVAVQAVMQHLDVSGDEVLQPDEFVTMDQLRIHLHELGREEQRQLSLQEQSNDNDKPTKETGILQTFFKTFHSTGGIKNNDKTCESNDDCPAPEVCCDFHFAKMCCYVGQDGQKFAVTIRYNSSPTAVLRIILYTLHAMDCILSQLWANSCLAMANHAKYLRDSISTIMNQQ